MIPKTHLDYSKNGIVSILAIPTTNSKNSIVSILTIPTTLPFTLKRHEYILKMVNLLRGANTSIE